MSISRFGAALLDRLRSIAERSLAGSPSNGEAIAVGAGKAGDCLQTPCPTASPQQLPERSSGLQVWALCPLRARGEGVVSGARSELAKDAGAHFDSRAIDVFSDSTSEKVHWLQMGRLPLEDDEQWRCSHVEYFVTGKYEYLAALVHVSADVSSGTPSENRLLIERACKEQMDGLVHSVFGEGWEAMWVNRTALVSDASSKELTSWISSGAKSVHEGGLSRDSAPYLITSWGNGVINEAEFHDPFIGVKFREGMVDAQSIWLDLELIADQAERLVEAQIEGETRTQIGDRQTEALLVSVAQHNLMFDEVLLDTSAVRSAIATSVLESWRYPLLRDRVDQRVRDADALAQRRRLRREARYEARVSNVLLILSIVSSVQLILAVVALAYSGAVPDFPGQRSASVVNGIRAVDADIWLLLTFLSAGMLYAFVALRRRL